MRGVAVRAPAKGSSSGIDSKVRSNVLSARMNDGSDNGASRMPLPARVYTDSSYAIGVLSLNWKAKANVELVAEIRDAVGRFDDLRFVKVPGHAGVPENERCDELARTAVTGRR